jgi:Patatin-like phospholipase
MAGHDQPPGTTGEQAAPTPTTATTTTTATATATATATVATGEDRGILQVDATQRFAESKVDRGERREYTLWGRRRPPIPSFTGLVEPAEAGKIGIACSGGGIRSAAFSLGALQTLQQERKLQQARYLAGVSGGSYIAAAFSMVRKTWPARSGQPPHCDDSDPCAVNAEHPPFFRGSPEEQYLRNRSSYMAPGAFGKLQFGYRLLLGMGVNLLFIAFAVFTLAVPLALLYGAIYPRLTAHVAPSGLCAALAGAATASAQRAALCHFDPLHIPTALWISLSVLAGLAVAVGAASILAYRWRGWLAEAIQVISLRVLLVASALAFLLIGLPVLLSLVRALGAATGVRAPSAPAASLMPAHAHGAEEVSPAAAVAVGAGGTVTLAGAVLLQLRADWATAKVAVGDVGKARAWYGKLSPRLRVLLAYLIAALVGPALTLMVALLAMTVALNLRHPWERWTLAGALALAFTIAYYFADTTSWSLHSFYRRRLCSAFALRRVRRPPPEDERRGYPPIAAPDAGIALERDYHNPVRLSRTAIPAEDGAEPFPTLLVCASANISDDAATPPGRAVTSFTFSATAMGGPLVGAVETSELEDSLDADRLRYFTLPAAVAMSGAALSPSMGKMTRWPLRFLMGVANVRLGVWVPNPRHLQLFQASNAARREHRRRAEDGQPGATRSRAHAAAATRSRAEDGQPGATRSRAHAAAATGSRTHAAAATGSRTRTLVRRFASRRPRPSYLLRELLGINSINAPYLYVTDGGHYENLGLVELLRRGCTEIYVFDASNDDFGAIGDAVALARSELDVEVEVDYSQLKPKGKAMLSKTDCVAATVKYPGRPAPEAKLFYARLTMVEGAPADAVAYAAQDRRFPHDPTTDQLYTDQRFEAYRSLGAHAAATALSRRSEWSPVPAHP